MEKYTVEDFGPNGEEVMELIKKARNLTLEQVQGLDAAWGIRRRPYRGAQIPHAVWGASSYAVWDTVWDAVCDGAWGCVWDDAWDDAWDAVWNAARALVVRDRISEEHFNILYGPWASVMEIDQEDN